MQEDLKVTVQDDSDDSNDDSDHDTDFETGIFVKTSIPAFFMGFNIGSRDAAQLVALVTGSNLLWLQCKPGIGGNRTFYKNYWPGESSIYAANVRCEDFCSSTPLTCIPTPTLCWYVLKYLGEIVVRGNLAFERFIFGSSFDNQPAHELNPLFGCTRKNSCIDKFNGVSGLGPSGISLTSQLDNSEFSYCIENLNDPFDEKNILIIGIKSGGVENSTPLIIREFHYYVNVEGINDKKDLRIDNFKSGGGAIIDSGSSLSFLYDIAYEKLDYIGDSLERRYFFLDKYQHCYIGHLFRDFKGFTTIAFHFDGATMELDRENLFKQVYSDVVCLSVLNVAENGVDHSLLGVELQKYFYISFDMNEMPVNFERIECEYFNNWS
ncbi:aspartic proteinase CDR1-like [Coffea eugenioides]|uniref:aspartic proteinase CDR1-like n=1 Tax=Coffea eugenioides TaxID=49369 RepID=UPI000F60FB5D|nr:aspartic proteinase CDR1-like [Coffea eugenioides]XP_027155762.1 aspartic proteinase CDR1-like [Coffea eugenioides]XP_027157246.1 aspartic proteinase CDR1-like [Coffea eugenioides]XP_027157248.1 aspartic proteinase CDR1-like [Coffea eugenioides]